jgi:hypothetical protein
MREEDNRSKKRGEGGVAWKFASGKGARGTKHKKQHNPLVNP